jgi:hypothetical protein
MFASLVVCEKLINDSNRINDGVTKLLLFYCLLLDKSVGYIACKSAHLRPHNVLIYFIDNGTPGTPRMLFIDSTLLYASRMIKI